MCYFCDAYTAMLNGDSQSTGPQAEAEELLRPSLEMMLSDGTQAVFTASARQPNPETLNRTLSLTVETLQTLLPSFVADDSDYLANMRQAFGNSFSAEAAFDLVADLQSGDLSILPNIEFRSDAELNGARGAYDVTASTIYLSAEFFGLYQEDVSTLVAVVAEELGHHIDIVLNGAVDSRGDEGAIFSALLQGQSLSVETLQNLRAEDDTAVVELTNEVDGKNGEEPSDNSLARTAQVEQNQGSQISFTDVTATAGDFISGRSYGAGAWGDFNGDGLPDLWVNNHFGPEANLFNRTLFVNNGDGTFNNVVADVLAGTSDVFLAEELQGDYHGSAWADFDNDGDQDLLQLVGGEGNTSVLGQENLPPRSEPNRLYINDNGVLRDQATSLGVAYDSAKAQAAIWFDYDNDGKLDIFHGSTQRADGLNPTTVFHQKANGSFENVGNSVLSTDLQGKTIKFGGLADFSESSQLDLVFPGGPAIILDSTTTPFNDITDEVAGGFSPLKGARDFAVADFNNDLLMDVYFTRGGDDRLLFNTAQGLVDVTATAGIDSVDTSVGGGAVAADFDNDMDIDVFIVRGNQGTTNLSNVLFDNQGDGTFVAVANAGGVLPAVNGIGDNVTTADYDVDGFVDLFVTNGTSSATNGPQQLFRNQGTSNNNWLQIDLEGVVTNRDGIGATVYVTAGGVTQRRDQSGGVHERSQNHQRLHFGLAQNTQVDLIEIRWPSGIVQQIETVSVNQVLKIVEEDTDLGAPVANDDSLITVDSIPVTFTAAELLSNDDLADTPTTVTAVDGTSLNNAVIVDNQDGTYTYTSAAGFSGSDSFGYTITDADGETSNATVTVTVDELDDSLITSGLVLNLDGDVGVSENNGVVTGWADQSGLGNDVTGSGDPTVLNGVLNGHSVIEFDGKGDKLARTLALNGLPAGNAERTLFLVARYDGTGTGGATYGDNTRNETFGAVVTSGGNLMSHGWGRANDFDSGEAGTGEGWLLQEIVHDGTTMSHYRDGNLIDSQAHIYDTDITGGEGLVIGAEIDSSPNVDMDVAALLVYDRALSDIERQQVERYLQDRYFAGGDQPVAVVDSTSSTGGAAVVIDPAVLLSNDYLGDRPTTVTAVESISAGGGSITANSDGTYTYTPSVGFSGIDSFDYTIADADGQTSSAAVEVTVEAAPTPFLFSLRAAATVGSIAAGAEDVVQSDGTTASMFFDGSDVGLDTAEANIDAIAAISATEILMSFAQPTTLAGLGVIDDSDIVRFTATSLGETTAGTFEMYFDGSDVGLSTSGEDIDGLTGLSNNSLIVSTQGKFNVDGISGQDEDLLLFNPTSLGENTQGSWSLYFDGSDVGLADNGGEDVDAVGLDAEGTLFLSTTANAQAANLSAADEDIFGFVETSLGANTSGSFTTPLFFDGSELGLSRSSDVAALDVTVPVI